MTDMVTKRCYTCGEVKPISSYGLNGQNKDGHFGSCKLCRNAYLRSRYDSDNPAQRESQRWRQIKHNYGITKAEWLAMYAAQEGLCGICSKPLSTEQFKTAGNRQSTCIDHDHDTHKVRGLLCHSCNLGIGNMQHDVATLQRAIEYLERTA